MRLSDIKGERALEVVADLVVPVANIAMDSEAVEMFQKKQVPEGTDVREFTINRLKSSMPALIRNHKNDLISIFASINDMDYDECLAELNIGTLMKWLVDIVSDEVFIQLFT